MSLRLSVTLILLAGALSAPIAFRSSAGSEDAKITGRELLTLAQSSRGVSYTFDHATARALEATELERPPKSADGEALEAALRAAGFQVEPVGQEPGKLFRVRATGS